MDEKAKEAGPEINDYTAGIDLEDPKLCAVDATGFEGGQAKAGRSSCFDRVPLETKALRCGYNPHDKLDHFHFSVKTASSCKIIRPAWLEQATSR